MKRAQLASEISFYYINGDIFIVLLLLLLLLVLQYNIVPTIHLGHNQLLILVFISSHNTPLVYRRVTICMLGYLDGLFVVVDHDMQI